MECIVDPKKLQELTEIFRKGGAPDPEAWAHSQLAEGINQLAIFSMAKAAWCCIMKESDNELVKNIGRFATDNPNRPLSQGDMAIKEMLEKGIPAEIIIDLIRATQYEAIFQTFCIIEGVTEVLGVFRSLEIALIAAPVGD